jgi:hypothetical protein
MINPIVMAGQMTQNIQTLIALHVVPSLRADHSKRRTHWRKMKSIIRSSRSGVMTRYQEIAL